MSDHQKPVRRIAVIAVHGVANQPPGETVRKVTDLLLKTSKDALHSYSPCDETDLRIAVERMEVPKEPISDSVKLRHSPLEERSTYVQHLQMTPEVADQPLDEDQAGLEFMRTQVQDYIPKGEDAIYETTRLRTTRGESCGEAFEVHLYEMYWADLSRLGAGLLRILGELYQLLFHLGSLGRQTADYVWAAHANDFSGPFWHAFQFCVKWAVRFLTLPIPILNLLLVAAVCMPLPGRIFGDYSEPVALLFLAVAAGVGAVWLLLRFEKVPWIVWLLAPPIAATLAVLIGQKVIHPDLSGIVSLSPYQLLAFEWCAVATVAIALIVSAYDRRRPGAKWIALLIGVPFLLFAVIPHILLARESPAEIFNAALKLVELLFLCEFVSWACLTAFEWLTGATAILAVGATPRTDAAEVSRSQRAAGTACLAVSLPSLLFLLLTLVLYRALLQLGPRVFPEDLQYNPSIILTKYFGFNTELSAIEFLNQLVDVSATPLFVVTLCMIAFILVMAIWALLPAARYDLSPPTINSRRLATTLGNWLTWGYRLLTCVGVVAFLTFPVLFTIGAVAMFLNMRFRFLPEGGNAPIWAMLGTLTVGSVGSLMAFHGRLENIAMGFRPILDTILDVDNHLREHPYDANPRARISCRFVSLLRYLCSWQDTRDKGRYEGVIIVSHSQGTVISADLLRFLKKFPDTELARLGSDELPVYLFTMGCPLRQLYGWRFPHLYAWARHEDSRSWTLGNPTNIPSDQKPDPGKLGVKQWVNAFRSGDYVGRYLWRADKCDYHWASPAPIPAIQSQDENGIRREFCIGAGGHNHYFDETAPEVALELDRLIRQMAYRIPPAGPANLLGAECLEPNEKQLIDQIVEISQQLLDKKPRPVLRGQHPKQHGCLKATFEVRRDLPPSLAVGLFSRPGEYDAFVRFSNGREVDDRNPDIHGMAVKVLGVPGVKLIEDEKSAQDFVMIDHPLFFIRNLTDYVPFSQMLLDLQNSSRFWVVFRLYWFFLMRSQLRQFHILRESRGKHIANPLEVQYWSTTPSLWKDSAVKYSARPTGAALEQPSVPASADFLREAMKKKLDDDPEVCFDFMVQMQEDPVRHPIEDPTVEWDSSWHVVASIRIRRQSFADPASMQQCEKRSFTPWHSLPDHQPLGSINRARKSVYASLSTTRRRLNGVEP
jgi:hypothetical protein